MKKEKKIFSKQFVTTEPTKKENFSMDVFCLCWKNIRKYFVNSSLE